MYAVPSPSFPARCIVWTRGLVLAVSSAMTPVPSGELSSTTRISSRGSCARTCGTRVGRFAASLYVGTTINARSDMPSAPQRRRHQHQRQEQRERCEGDRLAGFEIARAEAELYLFCSCGHRHREECVVPAQHLRGGAV